ncbi:MAG: hypothetical protein JO197_17865 [Acidobacteria bacterium]|nr:hypothetical protein [Acidobacteriota bacterium]MBV9478972.1 hypothetical protein [Acidobacteriota bacterium]
MERHVEWTSPAALWNDFNGATTADQRRVFRTPAILRFATDEFMPDFINVVQTDAHRISDFLAVPETWRKPAADVAPVRPKTGLAGTLERARIAAVRKVEARSGVVRTNAWNNAATTRPLKFYQPAHQRYYLVTACLVCRTLGLPDRALDTTKQERATFVIRMLQPHAGAAAINPDPSQCSELALVGDEWKPAGDASSLVDGETQYPLSPLSYQEIDGRRRRMFNGLIPVAKREALLAAKMPDPGSSSAAQKPLDARQMMLKTQVLGPWSNLEDAASLAVQQIATVDDPPTNAQRDKTLATTNDQLQTVSWYILLDLDAWLKENLADVWNAITAQSSAGLSGTKLAAYQKLASLSDTMTLVAALKQIRASAEQLETVKTVFHESSPSGWPSMRFRFVHASAGGPTGLTGKALRESFESTLVAALDQPLPGVATMAPRTVAQVNVTPHRSPWFAVRCVFERPNCASFKPAVVSDPTAAFQMAGFFDPDAPARPIRIPMPADTTPAGLRKFDKNTAFVLSDVLCGQVSAIRGLSFGDLIRSVLPWPLHKDLDVSPSPCTDGGMEAGMVCSLSIPIITICALIMLMIFIKLLDIVFFWLPFFQICLPLPKFDAKLDVSVEVGP